MQSFLKCWCSTKTEYASESQQNKNRSGCCTCLLKSSDGEWTASRHLKIGSVSHILSQGLKASAEGDLRMRAAASLDMAGTSNRIDRYDGFWTIQQRLVNTTR